MKRPRPYIPIAIRLQVAIRQFDADNRGGSTNFFIRMRRVYGNTGQRGRLAWILKALFPLATPEIDHDPALILRQFSPVSGKYTPDANNPDYLIWREKAAHQEKTTGRRPGASRTITTKGSDIGLKTKFARLEGKPKRRLKILSRGFQKRDAVR